MSAANQRHRVGRLPEAGERALREPQAASLSACGQLRRAALLVLVGLAAACGHRAAAPGASTPAAKANDAAAAAPIATALTGEITEDDRRALAKMPKGSEPFRPRWPNGRLRAIGFICDGEPIGDCAYYDEDGRIRSRGRYLYGALKDGPWELWYADGHRQSQGSYARGLEQGEWRYWHPNGALAMEGSYDRGKKHGPWTSWHENGRKQSEGRFIEDKKVARWHYWDLDGGSAGDIDYLTY